MNVTARYSKMGPQLSLRVADLMMQFLNEFLGGRIISRPLWPPHSPDLTPPPPHQFLFIDLSQRQGL